jgi:hypothetical protein
MEQMAPMTDHQMRVEALANAVRHRLKEETADDVVKSAAKYYDFLKNGAAVDKAA